MKCVGRAEMSLCFYIIAVLALIKDPPQGEGE